MIVLVVVAAQLSVNKVFFVQVVKKIIVKRTVKMTMEIVP